MNDDARKKIVSIVERLSSDMRRHKAYMKTAKENYENSLANYRKAKGTKEYFDSLLKEDDELRS